MLTSSVRKRVGLRTSCTPSPDCSSSAGTTRRWHSSPRQLVSSRSGSITYRSRMSDPGLVALLVGKVSVVFERGITFSVTPRSRLGATSGLTDVLATVTGNLIEPKRRRTVHVDSDWH